MVETTINISVQNEASVWSSGRNVNQAAAQIAGFVDNTSIGVTVGTITITDERDIRDPNTRGRLQGERRPTTDRARLGAAITAAGRATPAYTAAAIQTRFNQLNAALTTNQNSSYDLARVRTALQGAHLTLAQVMQASGENDTLIASLLRQANLNPDDYSRDMGALDLLFANGQNPTLTQLLANPTFNRYVVGGANASTLSPAGQALITRARERATALGWRPTTPAPHARNAAEALNARGVTFETFQRPNHVLDYPAFARLAARYVVNWNTEDFDHDIDSGAAMRRFERLFDVIDNHMRLNGSGDHQVTTEEFEFFLQTVEAYAQATGTSVEDAIEAYLTRDYTEANINSLVSASQALNTGLPNFDLTTRDSIRSALEASGLPATTITTIMEGLQFNTQGTLIVPEGRTAASVITSQFTRTAIVNQTQVATLPGGRLIFYSREDAERLASGLRVNVFDPREMQTIMEEDPSMSYVQATSEYLSRLTDPRDIELSLAIIANHQAFGVSLGAGDTCRTLSRMITTDDRVNNALVTMYTTQGSLGAAYAIIHDRMPAASNREQLLGQIVTAAMNRSLATSDNPQAQTSRLAVAARILLENPSLPNRNELAAQVGTQLLQSGQRLVGFPATLQLTAAGTAGTTHRVNLNNASDPRELALAIFREVIPEGATVTLQGSNRPVTRADLMRQARDAGYEPLETWTLRHRVFNDPVNPDQLTDNESDINQAMTTLQGIIAAHPASANETDENILARSAALGLLGEIAGAQGRRVFGQGERAGRPTATRGTRATAATRGWGATAALRLFQIMAEAERQAAQGYHVLRERATTATDPEHRNRVNFYADETSRRFAITAQVALDYRSLWIKKKDGYDTGSQFMPLPSRERPGCRDAFVALLNTIPLRQRVIVRGLNSASGEQPEPRLIEQVNMTVNHIQHRARALAATTDPNTAPTATARPARGTTPAPTGSLTDRFFAIMQEHNPNPTTTGIPAPAPTPTVRPQAPVIRPQAPVIRPQAPVAQAQRRGDIG